MSKKDTAATEEYVNGLLKERCIPLLLQKSIESSTFRKVIPGISNMLPTINDLVTAYEHLISITQTHMANLPDGTEATHSEVVLFQALIMARSQLLGGLLTLFRGHRSDSASYLRKAIEYIIFAARAFAKPNTATLWLQAGDSEKAFQKYMAEFKIFTLMDESKAEATWRDLYAQYEHFKPLFSIYDVCCRHVHATILSAGPKRQTKEGQQGLVFEIGYVDLDVMDSARTIFPVFITHLKSHVGILLFATRVLIPRTQIALETQSYLKHLEKIDLTVSAGAEAWAEAMKEETKSIAAQEENPSS